MAITAEEALARYKESGLDLTQEEVVEMGKEEFRKLLALILEDPETREPFIMALADRWFSLYELGEATKTP